MKYDPRGGHLAHPDPLYAVIGGPLEEGSIILLCSEQAHEGPIRSMQFDRQGRILVTAGEDGSLRAWQFEDGKLSKVATLEQAIDCEFHVIAYIAHSCTVIAAAADASLGVWKMRKKTFKEACKVETAHVNVINAMHYDAELSIVFTACHSDPGWQVFNRHLLGPC
eukprot:Skav228059  [mRNA]  locus=scaffold2067:92492:95844:- [translate_table: standard]